jgi:uncharacterized protein CbrC (UPF0167 family)
MAQTVVHQPRVAWDGARAFVTAAAGDTFDSFADQVATKLGPEVFGELAETRARIQESWLASGGDRQVFDVELGKWRVRLDDLLRTRPDLIPAVQELSS